jgi:hypothetical protein
VLPLRNSYKLNTQNATFPETGVIKRIKTRRGIGGSNKKKRKVLDDGAVGGEGGGRHIAKRKMLRSLDCFSIWQFVRY